MFAWLRRCTTTRREMVQSNNKARCTIFYKSPSLSSLSPHLLLLSLSHCSPSPALLPSTTTEAAGVPTVEPSSAATLLASAAVRVAPTGTDAIGGVLATVPDVCGASDVATVLAAAAAVALGTTAAVEPADVGAAVLDATGAVGFSRAHSAAACARFATTASLASCPSRRPSPFAAPKQPR